MIKVRKVAKNVTFRPFEVRHFINQIEIGLNNESTCFMAVSSILLREQVTPPPPQPPSDKIKKEMGSTFFLMLTLG